MFKKLIATVVAFATGTFLIPTIINAQRYNFDYYYDTPAYYDEGAFAFASAFMGAYILIFLCALAIALIIYIFTALQYIKIYKKNGLKDSAILAFIPIANIYFLAVAVGEKKNAPLYAFGPLGLFIFGCCAGIIPFVGILVFCGVVIAMIAIQAMLMMKVAVRMGKSDGLGLAQALTPMIPLVGTFISLYILYVIAEGTPVVSNTDEVKPVAAKFVESEAKEIKVSKEESDKKTDKADDKENEDKVTEESEDEEKKEKKSEQKSKRDEDLSSDSARIK